ncbi:MAG: DUF3299 domain-containing protein [Pseudomonadota bacterium]
MRRLAHLIGLIALTVAGATAHASSAVAVVEWRDLMPNGERPPLPLFGHPGTSIELDIPEQKPDFRTNSAVLNQFVRIEGFAVPLDMEGGKVRRLLLVPFFGACIHLPPPPPNQIIDVTLAQPMRLPDLYAPVSVEGLLIAERSQTELAGTAYIVRDGTLH